MYAIYTKHITYLSFNAGDCARYTAIKRNICIRLFIELFKSLLLMRYNEISESRDTRYFSCPVTYLHSQMRSVLESSRFCSRLRGDFLVAC